MRDDQIDTATYELLPTPQGVHAREDDISELLHVESQLSKNESLRRKEDDTGRAGIKNEYVPKGSRFLPKWLPFKDFSELVYLLPVLLTTMPIILLAIYASTLSKALGETACLPNGNFTFPGQADIWDANLFFTISITAGRIGHWGYTKVKLIVSIACLLVLLCRHVLLHTLWIL